MVNLQCRLDILKDYIKRQINKILTEKVAAITAENNNNTSNRSNLTRNMLCKMQLKALLCSLFGDNTPPPEVVANLSVVKKIKEFQVINELL